MKKLLILVAVLAVASAKFIDIDLPQVQPIAVNWSQVRPIEDTDQYWARLPEEMQYLRKHEPDRRIVNGQEATPGQFPYQVLMEYDLSTGGYGFCGGSIINSNHVLTAAHCVWQAVRGYAIVGLHNRRINEPTQQRIPMLMIYYHADYNDYSLNNDIAVVRLSSHMTFNDRVQPARLPARGDNRQFVGYTGTVSGFGQYCDDCGVPDVLMYTSNTIITNTDCLAIFPYPDWVLNQHICMSTDGYRAFCRGDSGGPLTVNDGGSALQIGIVSFTSSHTCYYPNVYVRVTYFLEWILYVVSM